LPKCGAKPIFKTGVNKSTVIECESIDAYPNVTYFRLKPPFKDEMAAPDFGTINKFTVTPKKQLDFGIYQCIMRNEAGGKNCEIEIDLGSQPNPPNNCVVSYNRNANKTAAQINCKVGFNQGGSSSEFVVYERNLENNTLRHSGSVNIHNTGQTEFGYLTKEIDEHKYYEFVVMQKNNYGNSTEVVVSIGEKPQGLCRLLLIHDQL
jgi:hypothetical protein